MRVNNRAGMAFACLSPRRKRDFNGVSHLCGNGNCDEGAAHGFVLWPEWQKLTLLNKNTPKLPTKRIYATHNDVTTPVRSEYSWIKSTLAYEFVENTPIGRDMCPSYSLSLRCGRCAHAAYINRILYALRVLAFNLPEWAINQRHARRAMPQACRRDVRGAVKSVRSFSAREGGVENFRRFACF